MGGCGSGDKVKVIKKKNPFTIPGLENKTDFEFL